MVVVEPVAPVAARLRVWTEPRPGAGSLVDVGLFCLEGRLQVGDVLVMAASPDGTECPIRSEVLEIRFLQQMVDALDPVFSGDVLCSGSLGPVHGGWDVVAGHSESAVIAGLRFRPC